MNKTGSFLILQVDVKQYNIQILKSKVDNNINEIYFIHDKSIK